MVRSCDTLMCFERMGLFVLIFQLSSLRFWKSQDEMLIVRCGAHELHKLMYNVYHGVKAVKI